MNTLDRSAADEADIIGSSAEKAETDLRILFVIDSRFPGLGGAEAQAVKLAQALSARGVNVEYLAPRVIKGAHNSDEYDGIPIRFIEYPHVKFLGSLFMMANFAAFLIKNRGNYDCMHVHVTRLLTATAGIVRPWSGIPILTKISGFFEFEGGVLDQRKRFHPVNALMRLAMRNVDYVQTISNETRQKLMDAGFREDQIALIPNGIDISKPASPMPRNEQFTVGYCGRLREVKGVHVLLEGYAKCKRSRPDIEMRIKLAGDGNQEQELKTLATNLGIIDDVEFLGLVDDTASFYRTLDLYVQPSFAEGLPNAVIEAMHTGRAVLASDIGGNHDLIEESVSGHLFAAGDSDRLGELLIKCHDDPDDSIRMGKNGRAVIEEQYGMDNVIEQLVGVYRA